jgi:tape measure domain-containing protein
MAEIDPVILRLIADNQKYVADLRSTTTKVDQLLGTQEKRVKKLEAEMKKSSLAIGSSMRSLATSLAGYFTGRELIGLLDSFTRLQNNLRVAGVAGDQMKAVQDRLFASAQKYGVELEGLSKLFSTLTQASKELGASQNQIYGITDAVSASLKIAGISAQEASGALLQLGQALRGGKVQAEEYNSLLDGLYPLLEAAANGSAKWGGSVAKLTADVKAGTVTSQEFFQAILAGSNTLEAKAANATLTAAAGFTTLGNALTVYFGEADKANGVSAALGEALSLLADNLGTIIPALATLATALGVGLVTNAVRARVAILALGAAEVGAAGAAGTLGFAVGRAGQAIAAAFGGTVGIAILALGAGIYGLTQYTKGADQATGAYARTQAEADKATASAATAAEKLANAHGKARVEALALARAEAENIKQKLASARASVVLAQAELSRAKSFQAAQNAAAASAGGSVPGATGGVMRMTGARAVNSANTNLNAANKAVADLEGSLKSISAAISASGAPAVANVGTGGSGNRASGGGSSGPTAEELAHRFASERAQLMQQDNSAMASMAKSAEEEAEFELRNVELARLRTAADINANKDYTAAQKQVLLAQVDEIAEIEREGVERQKRMRLEQERTDFLQTAYDIERSELESARDGAVTQKERREIGLALIDLEYELKRQLLEQIIASKDTTEAMKKRAQLELDNLPGAQQRAKDANARDTRGPLEAYLERTDPRRNGERAEQLVVDELDHIHKGIYSAISDALGVGDDPLISGLIDMLLEQILFRPIADALSKGAGGGGGGILGGIFSAIGGLFGRASGGAVNGGQLYRVNEGSSPGRVEGFMPQGSGTIIPLGMMNQRAASPVSASPGVVRVEVVGGEMFDVRVRNISGDVSAQVVRGAAPEIIQAATKNTMNQSERPRL